MWHVLLLILYTRLTLPFSSAFAFILMCSFFGIISVSLSSFFQLCRTFREKRSSTSSQSVPLRKAERSCLTPLWPRCWSLTCSPTLSTLSLWPYLMEPTTSPVQRSHVLLRMVVSWKRLVDQFSTLQKVLGFRDSNENKHLWYSSYCV